jgi:hypothetical protein
MTDGKTSHPGDLEGFEHLLDSYGSDRTRWPAPQRLEYAGLLTGNAEAQRLFSEAEAFDRLLDLAPRPKTDKAALVDRIAAAAFADAPDVTPRWQVAALKRAMERPQAPKPSYFKRVSWQVTSVLAASLVLGTLTGFSGMLDRTVGPFVTASATDDGLTDVEVGQLALDSGTVPPSEEDLL